MQKLKPNSLTKIKMKLRTLIPYTISLRNDTKDELMVETEEIPDGCRPKLTIVLKKKEVH